MPPKFIQLNTAQRAAAEKYLSARIDRLAKGIVIPTDRMRADTLRVSLKKVDAQERLTNWEQSVLFQAIEMGG
jgi:hypothetical protein